MNIKAENDPYSNKILIHSIIWCFFIFASLIQFYESPFRINADFYFQWISGIMLFYLNYFYLVPKLLLPKKYAAYLSITISIIIVLAACRLNYFIIEPHDSPPNKLLNFARENLLRPKLIRRKHPLFFKIVPSFFYIFIIGASTTVRTLSEFYTNQKNKLIAETHRTTSELNYLRKQTNPHFLFNALNSIYSLAYKKSDLVPDAIVTLSEMMRYMLYETDNQTVTLEKEINYIKNYIELQKLRLNNIENIFINIHGDTRNKYIEPLLLIEFIDNAFKHGTDYKGVTHVKIKIIIEDNILDFWVENKIGNHKIDPENSGIGLANIESRLNLLYPNSHQLKITQEDKNYKVFLNLKLEEKQTKTF